MNTTGNKLEWGKRKTCENENANSKIGDKTERNRKTKKENIREEQI